MRYDLSTIDEFGKYIEKTCKTKKTAMKYVKELCLRYGNCKMFVWENDEIIDCDTFTRKIY